MVITRSNSKTEEDISDMEEETVEKDKNTDNVKKMLMKSKEDEDRREMREQNLKAKEDQRIANKRARQELSEKKNHQELLAEDIIDKIEDNNRILRLEMVFKRETTQQLVKEAKKIASILGYNYGAGEWYEKSYKVFNKDYKPIKIKK